MTERFFLRQGKRKSHKGLDQGNRVNVLNIDPCSFKNDVTLPAL